MPNFSRLIRAVGLLSASLLALERSLPAAFSSGFVTVNDHRLAEVAGIAQFSRVLSWWLKVQRRILRFERKIMSHGEPVPQ